MKNEMYDYLEEHGYISKNKKSNYQFELSEQRAECIANKHNSLIEDLVEENQELKKLLEKKEKQQKEFIEYLEDEIYTIEPKGTLINFNCDYDSEEDYIRGVEKRVKLDTLKNNLSKYKEIIGDKDE